MLKERTIDAIINAIDNIKRKDYISTVSDISASVCSGSVMFDTPYNNSHATATKNAFTQINQMIMPGFNQYAQQVISKGMPELYTDAFNKLKTTVDRSCMLRTSDTGDGNNVIRAFLSSKYNRIDDDAVVGSLVDTIGTKAEFTDKFKSIGGNITDTHTFIKFVSREPVFTIHADGRDRAFSTGLIFSNSETGHGTCQVQVLMIDNYCNNGCIFSSTNIGTFRLIHSGTDYSAKDRFGYITPPAIANSKLEALRMHIKGILDCACDPDTFSSYYNLIQSTASMSMDTDDPECIMKWVDQIGRHFDINETEKKAVVGRLIETNDRSLFGIQAAITDAAKYAETYDRKIELEAIGGKMLTTMPDRWETIKKLVNA